MSMVKELDILQAVASATWYDSHDDTECPSHAIPTEEMLGAWFSQCPREVIEEANDRLSAVFGYAPAGWGMYPGVHGTLQKEASSSQSAVFGAKVLRPSGLDFAFRSITAVHAIWEQMQDADAPAHPLGPIVRAWQDRPITIDPERRGIGIVPSVFVRRITPDEQASLPDLAAPRLPGPVLPAVPEKAYLPGLEPVDMAMPALLLALYDEASGLGRTPGPGTTLAMHLFVESLLSVPVAARTGELYRLGGRNRLTVREIVTDWAQWSPKNYRPTGKRTGEQLRNAFAHVRDIAIPMNRRGGFYFPVLLEAVSGWGLNDRIALLARVPREGAVGPSVDRAILRKLRKISEPAYRAYLSLCFEWDRYGASTKPTARAGNKRRLIRATRPIAHRDEQGRLLDTKDQLVIDSRGVPIKSPYDKRAIRTGECEPNPARDRYPPRNADDLIRMCFPLRIFEDPDARRAMYSRARRAIEIIETNGGCSIERLGMKERNGYLPWRIMPMDHAWNAVNPYRKKDQKAFRNP